MRSKDVLRVLIVDDEAPARQRMCDLLTDLADEQPTELLGVASNGLEALRLLADDPVDVVLADIRMPVMNGVELARALEGRPCPPAVIFTTAHEEHAVQAFEVAARDYLLKPVRAARLATALSRVARARSESGIDSVATGTSMMHELVVTQQGRIVKVPIDQVLYLYAEMKYVVVVTAQAEYLLDASLVQLEQRLGAPFLRIHRNCLVSRGAIAGVERGPDQRGDTRWQILLRQRHERLPVSRRQWPVVRQALEQ